MNGGMGRLALYFDEVKPGNASRPAKGRSLQCVYWTLMDLPDWFRTRGYGWFHFGVLTTKNMVALKGGLSALAAHVLKLFYSKDGWNFETVGGRVPCTCGQPYLVRAQCAAMLADEKAIKEVWSLKGPSGTKPCVCCKNVVGRMDVEIGGYLVHYRWARPEHFLICIQIQVSERWWNN